MGTARLPGRLVHIRPDQGVALVELDDGRRVGVGGRMPLWEEPYTSVWVSDIGPWQGPAIYGISEDGLEGSVEPNPDASTSFLGKILTYESDFGPGWVLLNCGHYVRFERQPPGGVPMRIGSPVVVSGLTPYVGSSADAWAGRKYVARELRAGAPLLGTRSALPSPLSREEWTRLREEQRAQGYRIREIDLAALSRRKWPDAAKIRKRALAIADGTADTSFAETAHLDPLFDPWSKTILAGWAPAFRLLVGGAPGERTSRVGGGTAHLSRTWPECRSCAKPLSLIAEFLLTELAPLLPEEDGSLAVFFCIDCGAESELVLREPAGAPIVRRPAPPLREAVGITMTPIRSRPRSLDLPSSDLLDELLSAARFEIVDGAFTYRDGGDLYDEGLGAAGEVHSRAGGFAAWIQDEESECETCGKPALHIATLADDTGFVMGDCGALYVLACKRKPACGWLDRAKIVFQSG